MNLSITASKTTSALNYSASQFQSSGNALSFHNVLANFTQNSTITNLQTNNKSINKESSPFIAQAFMPTSGVIATTAASKAPIEPFNIDDYYSIPESVVWGTIFIVKSIIRDTDMSGMTDIEAYDFIEQQYIDAFGENFRMARILQMPTSMTMYAAIGFSFTESLAEHFGVTGERGSFLAIYDINRERLFGDAADDEIYNYIRAKYPETLTHHDFILMHDEMRMVGLFNDDARWSPPPGRNGYGLFTCLPGRILGMANNHPDIPWEINLHKPINIPYVFGGYNMWQWQGDYDASPMLTEFIKNIFGGVLDERGWFIGGVMPWDQYGGRF